MTWTEDCLCWCQVCPARCTLRCCGCIIHDHAEPPPDDDPEEIQTMSRIRRVLRRLDELTDAFARGFSERERV